MLYHAVMVHSIAQLALFRQHLAMGRGFCQTRECFVLVAIYRPLARSKADQQCKGVKNMALTFFHQQNDARRLPFVASFGKNSQIGIQNVML